MRYLLDVLLELEFLGTRKGWSDELGLKPARQGVLGSRNIQKELSGDDGRL